MSFQWPALKGWVPVMMPAQCVRAVICPAELSRLFSGWRAGLCTGAVLSPAAVSSLQQLALTSLAVCNLSEDESAEMSLWRQHQIC